MRLTLLACMTGTLAASVGAGAAVERASADWKVQAGKSFQRAGEYTVRQRNTALQDAIGGYGEPDSCRVVGSPSHVVASWPRRGIWIDAWTYAVMPAGENGCISLT